MEFFKELESKKATMGLRVSVGLSTLEEVFLELSKRDKFINDEDEEPPIKPGNFERMIVRVGQRLPSIFGPKDQYFTPYCSPHLVL